MNFEDYENYYDFIKDENCNFSNFIDIDANVENKYIDSLINIHREVQSVILNDRKDITNKLKLLFDNKYSNFNFNANKKILKSEEVELLSNFGNRNHHHHYDYNFVFTDRYFDKIRVRKQKNKRIFIKSCQLFYKAKDEFDFYEVRRLILLDCFSLNLLELSDMIKKRSDFISCLRKCKDIPKNSYYLCFLSFNVKLGFYLNFFIIYNEKNKLKEDLYLKIIHIWIDVLNSDFNQIGSHSLYRDYEVFFMNFKDIGINRLSESSENKISNKLDDELIYILECLSYKSMLYSYKDYTIKTKTFVSGHLRPTQKRRTKNNQLYLGGDMQRSDYNNLLPITIGYNRRYLLEVVHWNPYTLNNASLLIVGQSGSGKTNMLRKICNQLIQAKIPVWVFDPYAPT